MAGTQSWLCPGGLSHDRLTVLQAFLQEPVPHCAELTGRVPEAKPLVESLRAVVIFSNLQRQLATPQLTPLGFDPFKQQATDSPPPIVRDDSEIMNIDQRACREGRETYKADGDADRCRTIERKKNQGCRMLPKP